MRRLRLLAFLLFLALLLAGYLVVAPEVVQPPGAWDPPPAPAYTGVLAPNTRLLSAHVVGRGQAVGPESVTVDARGALYTGLADGRVVRVDPVSDRLETIARTGSAAADCGRPEAEARCGRVLGTRLDAAGRLLVADAFRGVYAVEPEGETTRLSSAAGGTRYGFTDDLDVAKDGTLYFTDASFKYGRPDYRKDVLENGPWGRLLRLRPGAAEAEVLAKDLYFANGCTLSPDESAVLFTETSRYRVQRYWLTGPKAGQVELFAEGLPGLPDNIRPASAGGYWVALGARRSKALDFLHPRPLAKRFFAKLIPLDFFQEHFVPKVGLVVRLDEQAKLVESLWDPHAEVIWSISEAREVGGKLYLGSISADRIAVLELGVAGGSP